jgi:aspartyl-tRNA(Asn)/glutamyl-tRNA(Gln) amidotransferase subunit B
VEERPNAELFEAALAAGGPARRVTNLLLGIASKTANERGVLLPELGIGAGTYAALARLADEGTISATAAVTVFEELLKSPSADPRQVAEQKGLLQVRDAGATEQWVDQALAANPKAVDDAKNNPKKKQASMGFLRGAVMKLSQGKADPKMVGELLEKKLNG